MLDKGVVFAEKYEILECLSSGTQAIVYKALQRPLDRVVILKTLFPALTTNSEIVARFEREAKLLSALKDESVTKIFDFGKHNGIYFFVSEYIEGISIKELIERKGRLSPQFASYIILESAKILSRLHNQGIIHRDLKPGNILLSQDGKVKLTDFGLAMSLAMPSITIEGSILGTPTYMSPEQILGKPVDKKSDIYSLGVVFYELLTGINPFLAETYSAIMHNVLNLKPTPIYKIDKSLASTKDLWLIIEQMIDKIPTNRMENISEVVVKLDLWFNKPENKNWKLNTREWQSDDKKIVLANAQIKQVKSKSINFVYLSIGIVFLLIVLVVVNKIHKNNKSPLQTVKSVISESASTMQKSIDTTVSALSKTTNNNLTPEPVKSNTEKQEPLLNQKSKGFLKVSVIPWATVFIDGKEVFTTPKDTALELLSGQHNIKLINPNFPITESIVTIEPNKTLQFSIDLTKQVSYLQISVQPWADVYIDNVFKATTPISSPIILSSGKHKITLKNPYFPIYEEVIEFLPKQTVERNIVLK